MNDNTLRILDYHKIISELSSHASFSASKALADELRPVVTFPEAQLAQQETAEALILLERRPDITVGGARDVRPMVGRAELGAHVEPEELLQLATTLASARSIKRQIQRLAHTEEEDLGLLLDYADQVYDLTGLEQVILGAISERGEVLDSASPVLARIRQSMRRAYDRLQDILRTIISSSTYAQAIQEPIISVRDGRYVVPVKADFRSRLPGIIHDTSGSGQTLFVEPLGAVEAGNRWRELQVEEREEIERILREIAEKVAATAYEIRSTVAALARVDFSLAKARYANRIRATRPLLVGDGETGSSRYFLHLPDARHPLLAGRVVPITVDLQADSRVLIITGPNTGGKTVALRTVGLLTLMAQSGLYVPCGDGAQVPVFVGVFADIGDEQSLEQSLSTFSGHITNIIRILAEAGPNTLILLDELGAGTDPEEGSALAKAIVNYLLERRSFVMATTHYVELKGYAHTTPGVRNASVEFDDETLSPTYRLIIGLPGRSNALTIAERLGVPASILGEARSTVSPESVELNDMLAQIQTERDEAVAARIEARRDRDEAERMLARARSELEQAERSRERAVDEGRERAERELEDFRRELANIRIEVQLAAANARSDAVETVRSADERVNEMAHRVSVRRRRQPRPSASEKPREIGVGDRVYLRTLQTEGQVLDISDGIAEVQLGRLKTRVPVADLEFRSRKKQEARSQGRTNYNLDTSRNTASVELDLRGRRAEEVNRELEQYVDDAYVAGLPFLRIIHGKGTGVLRQVVRDYLKGHPLVESSNPASIEQGGEGVTVATLARR